MTSGCTRFSNAVRSEALAALTKASARTIGLSCIRVTQDAAMTTPSATSSDAARTLIRTTPCTDKDLSAPVTPQVHGKRRTRVPGLSSRPGGAAVSASAAASGAPPGAEERICLRNFFTCGHKFLQGSDLRHSRRVPP